MIALSQGAPFWYSVLDSVFGLKRKGDGKVEGGRPGVLRTMMAMTAVEGLEVQAVEEATAAAKAAAGGDPAPPAPRGTDISGRVR